LSPNTRSERRRYRRTSATLVVGLVVYLTLVVDRERVAGREEFYPASGWSLFSKVPNEVGDYAVRLVSVRSGRLDPPVFLEEAKNLYPGAWSSHAAHNTTQTLGQAIERGDADAAADARAMLERLYLNTRAPVTYELVARRYDPLERFRTGRIHEARTLATFSSGNTSKTPTTTTTQAGTTTAADAALGPRR
jgi:hypothetical protein